MANNNNIKEEHNCHSAMLQYKYKVERKKLIAEILPRGRL